MWKYAKICDYSLKENVIMFLEIFFWLKKFFPYKLTKVILYKKSHFFFSLFFCANRRINPWNTRENWSSWPNMRKICRKKMGKVCKNMHFRPRYAKKCKGKLGLIFQEILCFGKVTLTCALSTDRKTHVISYFYFP